MERTDNEEISPYERRRRRASSAGRSKIIELGYGKTGEIQWLHDLESQRQGLFEALFNTIEDDKAWCDEIIEQAQSNPEALINLCVRSREAAKWTLHPPKGKHYKEYLEEHKEACLQHIAFLELVISDMGVIHSLSTAPSLDIAARLVLLLPQQFDVGLPWVMGSFAQASEHLAAVRMLVDRKRYLSNKQKGGQSRAQGLGEDDLHSFLRPLVKILLQSESHRKNNGDRKAVLERHVQSIMEFWKSWPLFYLDRGTLADIVETILIDLNVIAERKKSLFVRGRRTPMARPQQFSRSIELEIGQCEAWQGGLATALKHILETSFGT